MLSVDHLELRIFIESIFKLSDLCIDQICLQNISVQRFRPEPPNNLAMYLGNNTAPNSVPNGTAVFLQATLTVSCQPAWCDEYVSSHENALISKIQQLIIEKIGTELISI